VQSVQSKGAGNSARHKSLAAFFHHFVFHWPVAACVDMGITEDWWLALSDVRKQVLKRSDTAR